MMEVDLRGAGRERTLHFFISGRQQKIYFYNLPSTVEFCVCFSLIFIFIPPIPFIIISSFIQFCLMTRKECVEFVSLEEGGERISKDGIEGEEEYEL